MPCGRSLFLDRLFLRLRIFLFWLRRSRKLSVSSILGYRSMLSSVFSFKLPETSSSPVIKDLIRLFKVETPVRPVHPPAWHLDVVLRYLISSTFEPLSSTPLRSLTKKALFLVAFAMAKRVGNYRQSVVMSRLHHLAPVCLTFPNS